MSELISRIITLGSQDPASVLPQETTIFENLVCNPDGNPDDLNQVRSNPRMVPARSGNFRRTRRPPATIEAMKIGMVSLSMPMDDIIDEEETKFIGELYVGLV